MKALSHENNIGNKGLNKIKLKNKVRAGWGPKIDEEGTW